MSMEYPPLPETLSRLDLAFEYGQDTMGRTEFEALINSFREQRYFRTVEARLLTRTNNVAILADVNNLKELATIQAGVVCALDRQDICTASLVPPWLAGPDEDKTLEALLDMGHVYGDFFLDGHKLLQHAEEVRNQHLQSLLLVTVPGALPIEVERVEFGYRCFMGLRLNPEIDWGVGEAQSITTFRPINK